MTFMSWDFIESRWRKETLTHKPALDYDTLKLWRQRKMAREVSTYNN